MRHQLFCVAILLVFFYGSFCEGKESHHMGRSREIFLHNRVINTVEEAAHDDFSGSANGLFYVNFKPMFAAERKNILALEEASNGRLHFDSYLPMATYVLYAPMSAVAELSQNPNVLWIGAVKPEDKMPSSFAKTLLDDRQEQEQEGEKKGFSPADDTTLTVLWSRTGASNTELEKEVAQVQAHMAKQFPSSLHFWTPVNRETHMSSLIISGANSAQQTSKMINWLLQEGSQRIRFIEPSAQNFPHSAFSTHVVVDGTYSCPTVEPLCDYNTYLGSGINGTGQIIGILDSGVDFNSCFFYDPSFTTDTSNPSARKIVYYQTNSGTGAGDATDGTGHGTFCAGLAVGAAADPSSDFTAEEIAQATTFNGIATGAQLYVVDVMRGVQQQLNIDIPNIGVAYLSPMNTAGARIVLIPWGSVVNLAGNKAFYSSQDNVFDTYTAQNPEFLVVASVGNLGLTSAGRITSPASSKNALAVGGSYNTHDSFLYTDYVPDLSIAAQHEYTKFCTIGALDNYYNEVFCTLMNQPTPCTSFQAVLCNSNFDGTPQGCCGLPYFAPICCPATVLNFWAASRALYSPDSGYPESSRGPTYDGRIKPEVLAPANRLYSAYQSNSSTPYCGLWNDTPYDGQAVTVNEGTSGSASVVAGAAALVRQWLIDGYYPAGVSGVPESIPFPNPTAALIKAIMINSGDSLFQINANGASAWEALPNLGYDIQGFGRVNLKNVLNVDPVINNVLLFDNQIIPYTNYTLRYCIRVNDGSTYVRVTAVWTDPPAAVGAGVALVNNLDLVLIRDDGHEYRANRKIEFDSVNNVEDIWAPALAGRVYTIAVHGTYIPQGPQPVAIVVSGDFFCNNPSDCLIDSLFCTGPGSSCPMDCSLRGECFNGECFCEAPYMGIDCSLTPCPNNCNGNGVCDGETGACICNDFWKSYDCSVENPTGTTDFVCPPCQCSGGVNTGAVVGIAIGCFIIGVVIFFPLGVWVGIRLLLRRKKKLIAKARALNSNRSHREALAPADGLDEEEN